MMRRIGVLVGLVALFGMAQVGLAAFADTAVFQQGLPNQFAPGGYSGAEDTSALYRWCWYGYDGMEYGVHFASENYGASQVLYVGYSGGFGPPPDFRPPEGMYIGFAGGDGVGLIRFDVAALAGRTIQSARLRMSLLSFSFSGFPESRPSFGGYLPVPPKDADWVAGTSDNAVQAGASCWSQKRHGEQDWATELLPMGFYGPDPADWSLSTPTGRSWPASDPLGHPSVYTEVYFDLEPALVSFWADHPGDNGGLRFVAWNPNVLSGYLVAVPSSEFENAELRPALEVTYVPEPSILVFLGTGVAVASGMRRRRVR